MKNLVTIIAALLLSFSSTLVSAQMDKQKLTEISRMMFVDGNSTYILVELYRDGFLKEGENVDLTYNLEGFVLNGKKIPEPYSSRYVELETKFLGRPLSKTGSGSFRCGGFWVDANLDEHGIPKPYPCGRLSSEQKFQHFINMLADDGLVEKTGNVAIHINTDGVTVNGHLLTTPLEKIYERHILELSGFKPDKTSGTFSILLKREGQ
jgi:hypothetical protein